MPAPSNISAGLRPAAGLGARGNLNVNLTPPTWAPATVLGANVPTPQQYIAVALAPAATLTITTINQPKSLTARLTPAASLISNELSLKFMKAQLQVTSRVTLIGIVPYAITQVQNIKAGLVPELLTNPYPYAGIIRSYTQFAGFNISAGLSVPMIGVGIPRSIAAGFGVGSLLNAAPLLAKFTGATLTAEVISVSDLELSKFSWDQYGSQLLYAAASGLEKAMIDVDAPRQVHIPAEIIIDTWDPYACPSLLLPYLAWAMGVTFWNDEWSEQTKRDWIAQQWQFKAWRGSNAGIDMVVDYAGRDVTPFGYAVRRIITQPQGQYPSPGITAEQQEVWLRSLPQVRVYQFQQPGQAYSDEFYINYSFLSP